MNITVSINQQKQQLKSVIVNNKIINTHYFNGFKLMYQIIYKYDVINAVINSHYKNNENFIGVIVPCHCLLW